MIQEIDVRPVHHNDGPETLIDLPRRIHASSRKLFEINLVIGGRWCCGHASGVLCDLDNELRDLEYVFRRTAAVNK